MWTNNSDNLSRWRNQVATRWSRALSKDTAEVPRQGQASGGHPHVLPKENLRGYFFNVTKNRGFTPLKVIMALTFTAAAYKMFVIEPNKQHKFTANKSQRESLDFIENDKNAKLARQYTNSALFRGPFDKSKGKEDILGIVPSDEQLEQKNHPTTHSSRGENISRAVSQGKQPLDKQ